MVYKKLFQTAEKFLKQASNDDLIGNRRTEGNPFEEKFVKKLETIEDEHERMKGCLSNIKTICLDFIQEGEDPRECLFKVYEEIQQCKYSRW